MRAKRFSVDEHKRTRHKLKAVNRVLCRIAVEIMERYGKGKPLGKAALLMASAVRQFGHLLEGQAVRELGPEQFDRQIRGVGGQSEHPGQPSSPAEESNPAFTGEPTDGK